MRTKKKYSNGQPRSSGTAGKSKKARAPKDYHRQAVAFHGGEMAYEAFVKDGRRGYGQKD